MTGSNFPTTVVRSARCGLRGTVRTPAFGRGCLLSFAPAAPGAFGVRRPSRLTQPVFAEKAFCGRPELLAAAEGSQPGERPAVGPLASAGEPGASPDAVRRDRIARADRRERTPEEPAVQGTVFVVEDDQPLARSLKWWLEKIPGVQVRTFGSAEEFLENFDPDQPGCVLSDVRMGGMDGLRLQRELRRRAPDAVMVLMSGYADVPMAVQAVNDGAFDFIEKPIDRPALRRTIIDAICEDARRRRERAEIEMARHRLAQLSPREREVLELLVEGKSNREVAERLDVSEKTVESHRSRIRAKLGVDSLAEMVRMYVLATNGGGQ